jgi:hypothetical protein
MATLKIHRANDYINALREYRLFVDGQKIGTISNNQTKDFEIPAGRHTLIARIDWCSSPELSFELNDNDSKTLLVGGLKNGNWIFPLIMIMFVLSLLLPNTSFNYYKLIFVLPPLLFILYILTIGRKDFLTLIEKGKVMSNNR